MAFWNRRKPDGDDQTDENHADRIRERTTTDRLRVLPHLLMMLFVGALFVGAVGVLGGKTMFEKTLTALAQPCGILWLALIMLTYFCLLLRQTWPALISMLCFFLLTIGGNSFVANWLAFQREAPYLEVDPMKLDPYDTVFVLGGGTETRMDGTVQLACSGDRVATAARLFHGGKIKNIICTGTQSFRSTENDLDPREEAAIILEDLLVPAENIGQMKGVNTLEEMQNIRKWLEANPNPGRVGILTSAWHLKRAMRLAESAGVIADPIPANFLTMPVSPSPKFLIPSASNLEITRTIVREYLAGLVNR